MASLDWFNRAGLKMRHLQILVALDDLGKTSKVASAFNVTQPAISKAMAELQAGLEMKLFERTPRGLAPTPAGQCMIRNARSMLALLRETGEELHGIAHGVPGKIRIGVLPATAASLLPACLEQLKAAAPATTAFVREGSMDTLLHELRTGGVEIIVGTLPPLKDETGLEEEVLFGDRTQLVVRWKHPLLRRSKLRWPDMSEYPWILPPVESLLHESLMTACRQNHMPPPVSVIETLSISVIREYLATHDAIATLPRSLALRFHAQKVVAPLPLDLPPLVRPVGMVWQRSRLLTPALQLFMKCARAAAKAEERKLQTGRDRRNP